MRTEGVLFLRRVITGDSGEDTGSADASTRRFFAAGMPPRPPDVGEDGVDLAAALRLTGDFLGDAGGFLGEAAATAADARFRRGVPEVSAAGETVLPGSGLFLMVAVARQLEGCDAGDGDTLEVPGERKRVPALSLEGETFPPFVACRACLIFLNCRTILAVWNLVFFGGKAMDRAIFCRVFAKSGGQKRHNRALKTAQR